MCYQFTAQEEKEITILCKHIIYYIFSFKCDFHRTSFSMWDFQPSLRHRIFSARGDFSENLKREISKRKEETEEVEISLEEKKLNMSDGRSTPGSGISVRVDF